MEFGPIPLVRRILLILVIEYEGSIQQGIFIPLLVVELVRMVALRLPLLLTYRQMFLETRWEIFISLNILLVVFVTSIPME